MGSAVRIYTLRGKERGRNGQRQKLICGTFQRRAQQIQPKLWSRDGFSESDEMVRLTDSDINQSLDAGCMTLEEAAFLSQVQFLGRAVSRGLSTVLKRRPADATVSTVTSFVQSFALTLKGIVLHCRY